MNDAWCNASHESFAVAQLPSYNGPTMGLRQPIRPGTGAPGARQKNEVNRRQQ
jgi:hypothetical protein